MGTQRQMQKAIMVFKALNGLTPKYLSDQTLSIDLTLLILMVLTRGLRFCLPPNAVDIVSVKCSFEMLYRDLIRLGHSLTSEDQDR